jgi:hypothetical protein
LIPRRSAAGFFIYPLTSRLPTLQLVAPYSSSGGSGGGYGITSAGEPPTVGLGDDGEGLEGQATPVILQVLASHAYEKDIEIYFHTLDGPAVVANDIGAALGSAAGGTGDYVTVPIETMGKVVIPAGTLLSAAIEVTILDDQIEETDEVFTVRISGPKTLAVGDGKTINYPIITKDTAKVTIKDNDVGEGGNNQEPILGEVSAMGGTSITSGTATTKVGESPAELRVLWRLSNFGEPLSTVDLSAKLVDANAQWSASINPTGLTARAA